MQITTFALKIKSKIERYINPKTYRLLSNPDEDKWQCHPTFQDFEDAEKDTHASFPKKLEVFGGNHSDLVAKIVRPRGFKQVRLQN